MKKLILFISMVMMNVVMARSTLVSPSLIQQVIFDVNGVLVHKKGPGKVRMIDDAMIELVDSLRRLGIKTYILSNMSKRTYDTLSKNNQLFEHFDGVACSFKTGVAKPDVASFLALCTEYKLDPKACIFIDDTLGHVVAARKLGMHGIDFTSASDCLKQLQAVIPSLQPS